MFAAGSTTKVVAAHQNFRIPIGRLVQHKVLNLVTVAIEAHLAVEAIGRLGYEHQIIENPNLAAIKSLNVMTHKDNPDGEAILETLNQGLAIMQQSGEWRDIVSTALRYQMENG